MLRFLDVWSQEYPNDFAGEIKRVDLFLDLLNYLKVSDNDKTRQMMEEIAANPSLVPTTDDVVPSTDFLSQYGASKMVRALAGSGDFPFGYSCVTYSIANTVSCSLQPRAQPF